MKLPHSIYESGDYLKSNPSWDREDCAWKAGFVVNLIQNHKIQPSSICDIGCGSGGVLAEIRHSYPDTDLFGYDIACDASQFWAEYTKMNINFQVGDFLKLNQRFYEIILLLDVIEHLLDPITFLVNLQELSQYIILHIPLDLSAITVLREKPILRQRHTVGHIHYFTKNLALSLLKECGYQVIDWQYSGATFNGPRRTWKTNLAAPARRLAYTVNKDFGVRALGGETLFVLAKYSH